MCLGASRSPDRRKFSTRAWAVFAREAVKSCASAKAPWDLERPMGRAVVPQLLHTLILCWSSIWITREPVGLCRWLAAARVANSGTWPAISIDHRRFLWAMRMRSHWCFFLLSRMGKRFCRVVPRAVMGATTALVGMLSDVVLAAESPMCLCSDDWLTSNFLNSQDHAKSDLFYE